VTLRIRPAQVGDARQLLALVHDHASFERAEASLTLDDLTRLLAGPAPVQLTVAEDRGVLLGYSAVTLDYALWRGRYWAHLDCLFVRAADRNRGTGKRLLAHAFAQALAAGADRLEWQTPDWNEAAIRFYCREGAACQTRKRFHLQQASAADHAGQ
jgi:GNAT superfamily N-acetyltransferase